MSVVFVNISTFIYSGVFRNKRLTDSQDLLRGFILTRCYINNTLNFIMSIAMHCGTHDYVFFDL